MLGKLILLLIFVPLIELFLLIEVGKRIGALNTICIVVVAGALGISLVRREGWHTWSRIEADLDHGRLPTDTLVEGLLVLIAGVLLIAPGLLTDLVGLVLLIRPIRRFAARRLRRRYQERLKVHFPDGFRSAADEDFIDVEAAPPRDTAPRRRKLIEDNPDDSSQ